MRRTRGLLIASAVLVATAAAPAIAAGQAVRVGSPEALLARAAAHYRSARTLAVRFEQTLSNPLTGRTVTSTGELLRRKPDLLAVRFDGSDDRVVADGKFIWIYLPTSAPGQVIRLPARAQAAVPLDPLGHVLDAPDGRYRVVDSGTATVGGRQVRAITLTPVARDAPFTSATVWIDDGGTVRRVEAIEPSGLVRRVTITSVRRGVALPLTAFRFDPPAGVRIVERAALGG